MDLWRKRLTQIGLVVTLAFAVPSPMGSASLDCSFTEQVECYNECYLNTLACTHDGGTILVGCSGECYAPGVCGSAVVCYYAG
jgi:hypothetical protein